MCTYTVSSFCHRWDLIGTGRWQRTLTFAEVKALTAFWHTPSSPRPRITFPLIALWLSYCESHISGRLWNVAAVTGHPRDCPNPCSCEEYSNDTGTTGRRKNSKRPPLCNSDPQGKRSSYTRGFGETKAEYSGGNERVSNWRQRGRPTIKVSQPSRHPSQSSQPMLFSPRSGVCRCTP